MLARLEAIAGVERAEIDHQGELLRLRVIDVAVLVDVRHALTELGYEASDAGAADAALRWYGSSTVSELSRVEANVIAGRVVPGFVASRGGLAAADEDRLLAAVADALYEYFRAHTLDATARPGALRSACADEVARAAVPIVGHERAQELRALIESDLGASERPGSWPRDVDTADPLGLPPATPLAMPVQLRVGHPALTINQGSTFVMTDDAGEIRGSGAHGIFARDTRFVSHYALYANGDPWRAVTSSATAYNAARIYLTNADLETEDGPIAKDTVSLVVSREVDEGVHEDIAISNYAQQAVRFNFEIAIRSDFADIFEVRRRRFVRRGRVSTEWSDRSHEMRTTYENRDFKRALAYRILESGSPPHLANGRVTFEVRLEPGETWRSCATFTLDLGTSERRAARDQPHRARATELDRKQQTWEGSVSALRCSNDDLRRLYFQSIEDIGALRLHEHDMAPQVWIPAAGVPWYVTVFGRDSLLVGLQTMPVHTGLARGALQALAALQAKDRDDPRDAQPGKIPHEMRYGELAHFGAIPHTPYYGSSDATALYLIALDELWRWTGDRDVLERHRDTALACLEWIDRYGDLDGDGLQEYRTFSKQGYENMGWKDSASAVVDAEGRPVGQPKALVELQGYVFDAWHRMAEVFDVLGEGERAAGLRRKAAVLRERVERLFWCEQEGSYAFALDADKRRADAVASNAGHLLWSGLPSPERARRVAERLFRDDMWSGWGIRTLSARNPAYNPHSYHRGSVWPHDNGIIAMGLRRYGLVAETARVAKGVLDAASCFVSYRLPELYAGIERGAGSFPVQYLDANVPQAWAAGSVFHLVRALLGLRADAPHGALTVDPVLPEWLPDVSLERVHVGEATVDLRVWLDGGRTRWDVARQEGEVEVRQGSWVPWPAAEPAAEEAAAR